MIGVFTPIFSRSIRAAQCEEDKRARWQRVPRLARGNADLAVDSSKSTSDRRMQPVDFLNHSVHVWHL